MREIREGICYIYIYIFFIAIVCLPREGFQMFFVAYVLGQALAPCGVESSRDTLPQVRLGWRGPGPLFDCF